jgi:hypothetical protein
MDFTPNKNEQIFARTLMQQKYKKLLLLVTCVGLGITLFAGLVISQIDARFSVIAYSSKPDLWVKNSKVMLRVEARSLPMDVALQLKAVKVEWRKPNHTESYGSYLLKDRFAHFLQGQVTTPAQLGAWDLYIQVEAVRKNSFGVSQNELVMLQTVKTIVMNQDLPEPIAFEENQKPNVAKASVGAVSLLLSQADHNLSYDLKSDVFLKATLQDQPYMGEILIQKKEGILGNQLPTSLYTNAQGLAHFEVNLQHPKVWVSLQTSAQEKAEWQSQADWFLLPTPTEVRLKTQTQKVGAFGLMRWQAESIKHKGEFTIDLWWRGVWCMSLVDLANGIERVGSLSIPKLEGITDDLLWVQASHSKYQPENMRSGRYLLYGGNEKWLKQKLEENPDLKEILKGFKDDDLKDEQVLRYLLGRIKPPVSDPSLLIDSEESTKQLVQGFKFVWQRRIANTLALIWLLMSVVVWVWMRAQNQKIKRDWLEAGQEGEIVEPFSMLWFLPALLFLSSFFAGLIFLILNVRW